MLAKKQGLPSEVLLTKEGHSSFGFLSSLASPARTIRHSSLIHLALLLSCLVTRLSWAEAVSDLPTPSTNSAPHSFTNRFLFIVETSKTMEPRSVNMLKIVEELLGTGMHGQLWAGDSVGVWTYDSDVHTGRFPVQQFSTNMQRAITLRAMSFLNQHKYENAGKLASAITLMDTVSRGSEFLTVVIINDGAEPILGTPFDKPINDSYKLWKKQQDDAKMPFVTVLQAENGKITHYSVSPAPWPVELPALPAEFVTAKTAPPPPAPAAAPKPAPVYAAPIIIRGPKPSAPPPAQPADAAASTNATTNQPPPAATAPATNAAATTGAPTVTPLATDIPESNKKLRPSLATTDQNANPAVPLAAANDTRKNASSTPSANPQSAPATLPTTLATTTALASSQPAPQPQTSESNSISAAAKPPSAAPPSDSHPTTATATLATDNPQASVAAAAEPGSLPILVRVGIGGLAVAAIGSALLLIRRARSTSRPSLITQSMEMDTQRHKS
jgi:hypothetical protein